LNSGHIDRAGVGDRVCGLLALRKMLLPISKSYSAARPRDLSFCIYISTYIQSENTHCRCRSRLLKYRAGWQKWPHERMDGIQTLNVFATLLGVTPSSRQLFAGRHQVAGFIVLTGLRWSSTPLWEEAHRRHSATRQSWSRADNVHHGTGDPPVPGEEGSSNTGYGASRRHTPPGSSGPVTSLQIRNPTSQTFPA
jgi:hypothetical protein